MMEQQSFQSSRMTAGDVSRAVRVDLKTVHNWVQRGLLRGSRTRGGHLRFLRTEVVRFLRTRGRPVPAEVVVRQPRVVTVALPLDQAPAIRAEREASIFEALLGFGTSSFDVIVVGLDRIETERVRELAVALVRQPVTQGMAVVGVSADPVRRREFLAGGADLVLAGPGAIPGAIAFVCGEGEPAEEADRPAVAVRTERASGLFPRVEVPLAQVAEIR
ncbi:MAG: helix-turn-helix domain-containing protein [Polyangiaceae bacterium]|nr:helix-turn-helix domain-containing protein [Polyangiaceae bacterium]